MKGASGLSLFSLPSVESVRKRHDGQFWAIDNRRLFVYKHCKVERVLVEVIRWEEPLRTSRVVSIGKRRRESRNMQPVAGEEDDEGKNLGKIIMKFLGPKMFQSFLQKGPVCLHSKTQFTIRQKHVS